MFDGGEDGRRPVRHGQALDAPAVGQAVADEIHAPHLIDLLRHLERHALTGRPFGLLALPHRQLGDAVNQPLD